MDHQRKKVLIVDDDEDFATATAVVLRNAGYDVGVCLGTATAAEEMRNTKPDLVILDVMFPEDPSAGFKLARDLRHHEQGLEGVPVLMLTAINARFPLGFGSYDIDDRFLPVADFLEKPVSFDVLLNRVRDLLEGTGPAPSDNEEPPHAV